MCCVDVDPNIILLAFLFAWARKTTKETKSKNATPPTAPPTMAPIGMLASGGAGIAGGGLAGKMGAKGGPCVTGSDGAGTKMVTDLVVMVGVVVTGTFAAERKAVAAEVELRRFVNVAVSEVGSEVSIWTIINTEPLTTVTLIKSSGTARSVAKADLIAAILVVS